MQQVFPQAPRGAHEVGAYPAPCVCEVVCQLLRIEAALPEHTPHAFDCSAPPSARPCPCLLFRSKQLHSLTPAAAVSVPQHSWSHASAPLAANSTVGGHVVPVRVSGASFLPMHRPAPRILLPSQAGYNSGAQGGPQQHQAPPFSTSVPGPHVIPVGAPHPTAARSGPQHFTPVHRRSHFGVQPGVAGTVFQPSAPFLSHAAHYGSASFSTPATLPPFAYNPTAGPTEASALLEAESEALWGDVGSGTTAGSSHELLGQPPGSTSQAARGMPPATPGPKHCADCACHAQHLGLPGSSAQLPTSAPAMRAPQQPLAVMGMSLGAAGGLWGPSPIRPPQPSHQTRPGLHVSGGEQCLPPQGTVVLTSRGTAAVPLIGNVYKGRSGVHSNRGIKTNPEVMGDPAAPTHTSMVPFVSQQAMTCHSCHYKREDVINCAHAMAHGGRHAYCANCLRRRCNVDFHAVRTGLVQWVCPVCSGSCPCATCKRKRGSKAKVPYPFKYSSKVDVSVISSKSGGQAEEPVIMDFGGTGDGRPPTVIRLQSAGRTRKSRSRSQLVRVSRTPLDPQGRGKKRGRLDSASGSTGSEMDSVQA